MAAIYQRHRPAGWRYLQTQITAGGGAVLPVPAGVPLCGVTDAADRRWLRAHRTPHPARSCTDRVPGDHAPTRHLPHRGIRCPDAATDPALAGAAHDGMVTQPRAVADLLLAVAAPVGTGDQEG